MKTTPTVLVLGAIASTLGSFALIPPLVQAGEVCNYNNRILRVAVAYPNQNEVWVSQGWWELDPGACLQYPDTWYTFLQFNRDNAPSRPQGQGVSTANLCVAQDRFTAYNATSFSTCEQLDSYFADLSLRNYVNIGSNRELVK